MGLRNLFKSVFAGSGPGGVSCRACVVDANGLAGSGANPPPRAQIQTLQRLARFASKESVAVIAVLDGKELRAVSNGEDYQGIRVFYSEKADDHQAAILSARKRSPGPAIVVTDSTELEAKVLAQGGSCMRLSTFRKALDTQSAGNGGGPDSRSRDRRSNRSGGSGRPRRSDRGGDRRDRRDRNDRGQRNDRKENQPSGDPVSDLIDLVE